MERKIMIALFCFIFLGSCNENIKENAGTQEVFQEQAEEDELPVLDNGNKWLVPPGMHRIIKEMQEVMNNSSFQSEKEQALRLNELIGELTGTCTMQGQGHEELHKILVPLIEKADNYEIAGNGKNGETNNQIRRLLQLYDAYFEEEVN